MKKGILVFFFCIVLVSMGCTNAPEEIDDKKSFFIETELSKDFPQEIIIKKTGKIGGSQEIFVSAQANGSVSSIYKDEGKNVAAGQPVIQLNDSIANYGSMLDRAKNALDRAILQYEQTNTSLNKSLSDTQSAVVQAENALDTTQKSAIQSLKKAKQDLDNTDLSEDSQAKLNIDKILTDIKNQVDNLKTQFPIEKTNNLNLLDDVLHQTDTLLGVTDRYKQKNDNIEQYLGAKNTAQKIKAETTLQQLYKIKDIVDQLPTTNLSNQDMKNGTEILSNSYDKIKEMLELMDSLLTDSVASYHFPQSTIDGHIAATNGQQSAMQTYNAAFVAYRQRIQSLLGDINISDQSDDEQINTIAQQQMKIAIKSTEIGQQNAKIGFETAKINAENAIFNAELQVKNAKIAYETLKTNNKIQLSLLKNGISEARISYHDAQSQFNKLSVRSTIHGTVGSMLVDEGQEVMMGTQLFTVVSDNDQLIEVSVTADEAKHLNIGKKAGIVYDDSFYVGKVVTISSVADRNTLYKVSFELEKSADFIGDVATVHIPVELDQTVLPINVVTSLTDGHGFVYVLQDGEPIKYDVELGKTRGDQIEITSSLPPALEIITTNMGNYDSEKFKLADPEQIDE